MGTAVGVIPGPRAIKATCSSSKVKAAETFGPNGEFRALNSAGLLNLKKPDLTWLIDFYVNNRESCAHVFAEDHFPPVSKENIQGSKTSVVVRMTQQLFC